MIYFIWIVDLNSLPCSIRVSLLDLLVFSRSQQRRFVASVVIVDGRTAVVPTPVLKTRRMLVLVVGLSESCIRNVSFDGGD